MTLQNTNGSRHTLADVESQIQRLQRARETLETKRHGLREEELKILADAFARKLQAGGFTVREGLAALKPYARTRLNAETPASPAPGAAAPSTRARAAAPASAPDLREHASRVLGGEASAWLRHPHPLLGGQTPQQMAATPQGLEKVHALLAAYARGA